MMRFAAGWTIVATTLAVPADTWAQDCQTRPLPIASDEVGIIDANDCRMSFGHERHEHWTLAAIEGDGVGIRIGWLTGQAGARIYDPAGELVDVLADTQAAYDGRAGMYLPFLARRSGEYRISVVAPGGAASYSVFAERTTAPLPGNARATSSFIGMRFDWTALSAAPILEYVLDVGSAPGARDLGTFAMGQVTNVVASAPQGRYYMRFRARNVNGWGPYSGVYTFDAAGVPASPGELHASDPSDTGHDVSFTWRSPAPQELSSVRHYELIVGSRSGAADLAVINVGLGTPTSFGRRTVYIPHVPPGTYYVRLRAVTVVGPSALSNEVVVTR